jgi:AcrR family transcriptional regulator
VSEQTVAVRRTAARTREHVLRVAHDLFYWHGIRAVGVDRIAAEAGVAPTTLYRVFASKDDLVAAYVERADRLYRQWFDDAATVAGSDHPRDRILAVFDALVDQTRPEVCRGCPFLMALAEFADPASLAHRNAVTMKNWVRARFGELATELAAVAPVGDPDVLADRLVLVMEGVYASVQALGANGPAARARDLVAALLPAPGRPAGLSDV